MGKILMLDDAKKRGLLEQVGTVAEICERWGKTRKAVMMNIYRDNFIARQSGSTWLVSLASVAARWGSPEEQEIN